MTFRASISTALLVSVLSGAGVLAQAKPNLEQAEFAAEGKDIQHPIPMPDDVWALLKRDEEVKDSLAQEKLSDAQAKLAWFDVAIVHLHKSNENDYVVVGKGPMNGAHGTVFWVILQNSQGIKVVLRSFSDALNLLLSRWHGYKNIDVVSLTAVSVTDMKYRFNGASYQMYGRQIEKTN